MLVYTILKCLLFRKQRITNIHKSEQYNLKNHKNIKIIKQNKKLVYFKSSYNAKSFSA